MGRVSYVFFISIPASTLDDTRQKLSAAITGTIKKLKIDIPSGWQYSAGVRIVAGRNNLPKQTADSEKYFTGDDDTLDLEPDIVLKEDKIEIFAINNDATNSHDAVLTFEVED